MKRILVWAAALQVALFLVAGSAAADGNAAARLLEANYRAVDQLLASIPSYRALDRRLPIIMSTVVNIDDLKGSRFGRVLAEQIGTRMSQDGYTMVELKLRDKIFVQQGEGELMLSREVKDLSTSQRAQAVVVGTYAESGGGVYSGSRGYVFVTLKIVDVTDDLVLAAHDYILPLDGNVRSLLYASRH